MITAAVDCQRCGRTTEIQLTMDQYEEIGHPETRRHIQDILPHVAPEVRELFISRICGKCFDEMFGQEEED